MFEKLVAIEPVSMIMLRKSSFTVIFRRMTKRSSAASGTRMPPC